MQSRRRAVAAGLLLTASLTVTSLATGGADAATGKGATHRSTQVTPRLAPPVTVAIAVTKNGITRSRTGFRPGWTRFDIRSAGGGGTVEVMRLRHGYTLRMLRRDFGGLFSGDVKAVRRVDHGVNFYGGNEVERHRTLSFATYLDAGRYLIANLDKGTLTRMRVSGRPEHRSHPHGTGRINLVPDDRFGNPGVRRHAGWMRSTNKTDEPHFINLDHVWRSTTHRQVRRWLARGANSLPKWELKSSAGTLVIGPGHTVYWKYDLPRGKYFEACWWPSDENGMPHAMMGMWDLTWLR